MKKSFGMALVLGSLCLAGLAMAQPPKQPPPEALEACESLASGDECSFSGPQGKVEGTCFTPDSSKPLACRPNQPPPPPPEALEACEDLKAGDACVVETPDGEMDGKCQSPDSSKPLACMPPRQGNKPPPPERSGSRSSK